MLRGVEVACERCPGAVILPLWRDLLSRTVAFSKLLDRIRRTPSLTYLTVDTTGVCDLTCSGMCYYHPDINVRRTPVTEEALQAAIAAERLLVAVRIPDPARILPAYVHECSGGMAPRIALALACYLYACWLCESAVER